MTKRRPLVLVDGRIRELPLTDTVDTGMLATIVSSDVNNRVTSGSDGGIFVPDDLATDPLAYYILAKA
jgi:hypothetical protein